MTSSSSKTLLSSTRPRSLLRDEAGFNLIEIMVVLVIIAGLAYLVGTNVIGNLAKSRVTTTQIQIKSLESAVKQFNIDQGFFPDTQQSLHALVQEPTTGRPVRKYPYAGYLDSSSVPADAWGNDYIYIGPDQTEGHLFEIISPGEDGVYPSDDDISSLDERR